jgi:hypothetical protein
MSETSEGALVPAVPSRMSVDNTTTTTRIGRPLKYPDSRRHALQRAVQKRLRDAKCPVEKSKASHRSCLKRRYGITPEDLDGMVASQGGACLICREPLVRVRGQFAVDHCHTTKRVRGVLCHSCNTHVGFYEKGAHLRSAIASYLGETDGRA